LSQNFTLSFFALTFLLLFCFVFASFNFFGSDAKTSKRLFFPFEVTKIRLRFASFCFEAKIMAVFHFRVASFCFEVKRMAVFGFCFASFRFKAKNMAVFCFFFVLFLLRSILVTLQISTFRINGKQAKKALFLH
jgi:hypothetical protein